MQLEHLLPALYLYNRKSSVYSEVIWGDISDKRIALGLPTHPQCVLKRIFYITYFLYWSVFPVTQLIWFEEAPQAWKTSVGTAVNSERQSLNYSVQILPAAKQNKRIIAYDGSAEGKGGGGGSRELQDNQNRFWSIRGCRRK